MGKAPIKDMLTEKRKHEKSGTSFGLSEAGYDLRIDQDITLSADKRFSLASACELFQMPHDLVGIVHDKSTWARQGLSVFNTVIEPGWHGYLTAELVYHGDGELFIPCGSGIAQVLFHEIAVDADYGNGKYQNQERGPVEARR